MSLIFFSNKIFLKKLQKKKNRVKSCVKQYIRTLFGATQLHYCFFNF